MKIFRALVSESAVAPSNVQVKSSLGEIAKRLGADDMTVTNHYKRLQEAGCMSVWQLGVNPTFFGYKMLDVMVDVQYEPGKADMIRKLRLIQGIVVIVNFYGKALKLIFLYDSDDMRSRTVELVSRITNAENIIQSNLNLPMSETKHLTKTDIALIGTLAKDARLSSTLVSKKSGFSTRTVRNRINKLRRERTLFTLPSLNLGDVPGLIPACLTFSYSRNELKRSVDQAVRAHFDSNYLWGGFSDPNRSFIVLSAVKMTDIRIFLEWTKDQPGIASARIDIPIDMISFPEKFAEILSVNKQRVRRNA